MGTANLEILGLQVPMEIAEVYHDDGYVESIEEHLKKFKAKDKNLRAAVENLDITKVGGVYFRWTKRFAKIHHHIVYLRQDSVEEAILIRAHEETHALDAFGGLDLLADKMLNEQGVRINFSEIDDNQTRAHLGAIYALVANGVNLEAVGSRREGFGTAKLIYEQARLQ